MTFFNKYAIEKLVVQEKLIKNEFIFDLCREISDKTKIIGDCIVYNQSNVELNKEFTGSSFFKKTYGDLTGFECSCNEITLGEDFFTKNTIFLFFKTLRDMFEEKFPDRKIVLLITERDECQLRFHIYREKEGLWIDEKIDNYKDEAIAYDL